MERSDYPDTDEELDGPQPTQEPDTHAPDSGSEGNALAQSVRAVSDEALEKLVVEQPYLPGDEQIFRAVATHRYTQQATWKREKRRGKQISSGVVSKGITESTQHDVADNRTQTGQPTELPERPYVRSERATRVLNTPRQSTAAVDKLLNRSAS
ncbi:Peroxide stress-activated histidine kinase mak3 [Elsinoe australis]|uniref:Peroxide stress-activated histidine kinase mak3 n=1 Tax=Elsinoe australis TaxID=40998 RepID=A0A2P7YCG5_9PEZI|nr:Peroxide stress-activated histidine kinase mak3 [Elsinoe australis]